MTIEQSKALKVGDAVSFKVGRNEYQTGTFVGFITVTDYGRLTLNDLCNLKRGFPTGGRKVQCAKVKYIGDFGNEIVDHIPLSRLTRY